MHTRRSQYFASRQSNGRRRWARLEEVDAFLDGGSTDVARRLDAGGRAVLAAAVTTLEDDRAYVAFTQRTVDRVCQRLAGCR